MTTYKVISDQKETAKISREPIPEITKKAAHQSETTPKKANNKTAAEGSTPIAEKHQTDTTQETNTSPAQKTEQETEQSIASPKKG